MELVTKSGLLYPLIHMIFEKSNQPFFLSELNGDLSHILISSVFSMNLLDHMVCAIQILANNAESSLPDLVSRMSVA